MAESTTGLPFWRLAQSRAEHPFEALCEAWREGAWKHKGATLVHTTSREEWERHLKEEHRGGVAGGHLRTETNRPFSFKPPRLTKKERELLGRWVTTPRGLHGQIWCMADRHNSRSHGSMYTPADVWVVVTVKGEYGSTNILQAWDSSQLTVHDADRGVMPGTLFQAAS